MEKLRTMILQRMADILSEEQLDDLANCLDVTMYDFNITEKSRELAIKDDFGMLMIKNFVGTKILEGCSERTVEMYKYTLTRFVEEIQKPLAEVDTNDLRHHLAALKENRKLSNTSLNHKRRIYSSFFKWLYTEKYIKENPMDRIKSFKVEKTIVNPFTTRERELLADACKTVRDRALFEFLYSTGARVAECADVTLNDVDFKTKEVFIKCGKGNKQRVTYLSETAELWLEKYLAERKSNEPNLWVGRQGKLSISGIENIVRKIGKSVGIDAHPHRFRHSLATDLIKRGAPVQDVQRILGHESIATTMIYVKLCDNEVKNTHNRLVA